MTDIRPAEIQFPRQGDHSPWGAIDTVTHLGPDVIGVTTSSHGGLWVSPEAMMQIPAQFRETQFSPGPWFEEDSDWAIPYAFLRLKRHEPTAERAAELKEAALDALRHWIPDAYEHLMGRTLAPGESRQRDRDTWKRVHETHWVVRSAFGDWADWVPPNKVGVHATVGGGDGRGRYFWIDAAEYRRAGPFGFAIDLGRHEETVAPELVTPGRKTQIRAAKIVDHCGEADLNGLRRNAEGRRLNPVAGPSGGVEASGRLTVQRRAGQPLR